MIDLTFNTVTKVARLVQAVTLKPGGDVPVRVTFSAAPDSLMGLTLALGSDATPPEVLAYTEDFTEESETVWTALLDASDTRLVNFMAAKSIATVNAELTAVIDGETAICPNVSVTVQHRVVSGDPTGEGGPEYYTAAEVDALLPARSVEVLDATARLALTTATVRTGDFAREVGRAEVTKLTCLGSTYTAAVAEVMDLDCTGLVAAALAGTSLYLHPDPQGVDLYELFWFRIDGAGSAPGGTGLTDGVHANFHAVAVTTGMTATQIAAALRSAIVATALFTSPASGTPVIRVTWLEAGPFYDANAVDSGVALSEITAGAAATHTLEGTTLTLYSGANVARSVGFSLAGNVGTIAVQLPALTRTAAQIAALVQPLIHAHADFSGVQGTEGATAEVTVTNAANGAATNADAGGTGFTVAVLTQGLAANTSIAAFELIDETQIGSESGWYALPAGLGTHGDILFSAQATLTSKSLSQDVFTFLAYNSAAINVGGAMNLATGVWTAPEDMVAEINLCNHIDNGANNIAPLRNSARLMASTDGGASFAQVIRLYSLTGIAAMGTFSLAVAAGTKLKVEVSWAGVPAAPVTAIKQLTCAGRNGAGAITLVGAAVLDTVAGVTNLTAPANASAAFQSAITVGNQIQQTSGSDLSASTFLVTLESIPAVYSAYSINGTGGFMQIIKRK